MLRFQLEVFMKKKQAEALIDTDKLDIFALHSSKCLSCKYLTDLLPEEELVDNTECHHSVGNKNCPAKYMFMTKGINMEKAARSLFLANTKGDVKKIATIYKKLGKYHPAIAEKVISLANLK